MSKPDRDALRRACYCLGHNIVYDNIREPPDIDEIESFVLEIFDHAIHFEERIDGKGRDSNMLIDFVKFINSSHAIPPMRMRGNTSWFYDMLLVLVELPVPNGFVGRSLGNEFRKIETNISLPRSHFDE